VINKIILAGRLAQEPKLYNAGQDNQRCNLRLAFNEVTGRDGQGQVQTEGRFVDVTVFGRSAGPVAQQTVKGQEVVVSGRLTQRETAKSADGYDRAVFSIIADPVGGVVFGRLPGQGANANGTSAPAPAAAAASSEAPPPF
jgi:single stranded DNA-binding protein